MRRRGATVLACALALAAPAAAGADPTADIVKEFRTSGVIDGCTHSEQVLQQAKTQVANNPQRKDPALARAIDDALAQRAAGKCPAAQQTQAQAAPAQTQAQTQAQPAPAQTQAQPAPVQTQAQPAPAQTQPTPAKDDGSQVPVWAFVAGALLALALILWGLARWWAWEPDWLVRWRHATGEAGWRASAAWAEFTDWLRLGR
jgi:hypothetical protein